MAKAKVQKERTMATLTLDREMAVVDDRRAAASAGSVYWPSWWAGRRQHYPPGTHEIPAGTLLVGDLVGDELAYTEPWQATLVTGVGDDLQTLNGRPVVRVGSDRLRVRLKYPRIVSGQIVLVAGGESVACGSGWHMAVHAIWALDFTEREAALSLRAGALRAEAEAEYAAELAALRQPTQLLDYDDLGVNDGYERDEGY